MHSKIFIGVGVPETFFGSFDGVLMLRSILGQKFVSVKYGEFLGSSHVRRIFVLFENVTITVYHVYARGTGTT